MHAIGRVPEDFVTVSWDNLKEGDMVFIQYLEYPIEGQPGVIHVKGPHYVQSVQLHELRNGNGASQFKWDGKLLRRE